MRLIGLGLVLALAVAGCGSPSAAVGGRGDLPRCVDGHPHAVKALAGVPVRHGRFVRSFSLDHGALQIEPTNRRSGVSYAQARCTFLSAATAQNWPLTDEMVNWAGMSIGLGLASVRSTPSYGYLGGVIGGDESPNPPPVRPFRSRLAWVAVIHPELAASCPGVTPKHPVHRRKTPPDVTGDQVLLLDAKAGADGMIYDARSVEACFGRTQPAFLAPLVQSISVPWTMVRRTGNRATIAASVRPCDGIRSTVHVDSYRPELVQVRVQRPVGRCGSPVRHEIDLQPATIYDTLPARLNHARTGALDVSPR